MANSIGTPHLGKWTPSPGPDSGGAPGGHSTFLAPNASPTLDFLQPSLTSAVSAAVLLDSTMACIATYV